MAKNVKPKAKKVTSLRTHRQMFCLNNEENKVLNRYLSKYKVQNKSKFIRETLMVAIIRRLEKDNPTLFD